ncbi:hypothetical protein D3C75_1015330 [compost metagenome]
MLPHRSVVRRRSLVDLPDIRLAHRGHFDQASQDFNTRPADHLVHLLLGAIHEQLNGSQERLINRTGHSYALSWML